MSVPTPDELGTAADLAELMAEELLRRAKEMETVANRLLSRVTGLNAAAAGLGVTVEDDTDGDEEHERNRWGETIRMSNVIAWAREHSPFTRREFQEGLKLTTGQASKWLARLTNNKPHPIVIFTLQGGAGRAHIYEYNTEFAPGPTKRPEHARQVDVLSGVGADAPVRGVTASYTGRPKGSSGKPGRDKRISERRPVRRGKDNVIGGR